MKPKKRIRKCLIGFQALVLVATIGFGTAWAWNSHQASQENNMQSRTVSVKINEEFPDPTVEAGKTKIKEVTLKNTGTAASFVRISYSESWITDTAQLEGNGEVQKNWTSSWTDDWMDGGDGWYYYKKVLPAGANVRILTGVTFPPTIPEDAEYTLDFMVESVQVSDQAEVNTDSTNKLFGKTGTVSNATIKNGAVTAGAVSWN